jgi:CRISPR-associated endoribonuclease Cas6
MAANDLFIKKQATGSGMNDLLSLELVMHPSENQPVEERPLPRWWGEATHRLAIQVIASGNESLAKKLESSAGLKPFTTSNLRGPFKNGKLDPGAAYKIRFTALEREVAEIFISADKEGILRPGSEIELDYLRFQIREQNRPDNGLAGTTYQALTNSLFAPQPAPRRLTLMFVSPTLFKWEKRQTPFPMPDLVFGSLLDHWNASDSIPTVLPEEVRTYARECVRLGRFDLHSRGLRLYGDVMRGFVGRVSFYAYTYDRYWMGILAMLAQFASYAGVGA